MIIVVHVTLQDCGGEQELWGLGPADNRRVTQCGRLRCAPGVRSASGVLRAPATHLTRPNMQASMRAAQASRLLSASSSVTSVVQRSASGATSHIPFASAPCCSPSYQIPSAASWPTLRRSLACHSASTDGAESDSTDSDSSVGLRKNFARPQIKTPLTKQQAAALLKSDGTEATWREMDSKVRRTTEQPNTSRMCLQPVSWGTVHEGVLCFALCTAKQVPYQAHLYSHRIRRGTVQAGYH